MLTETIHYQHDGIDFKAYIARPDNNSGKRPAVLVAHAWRGQNDFAKQKAEALAEIGYVGIAIDLYGNGTTAKDDDEAFHLMLPLFLDRQLLRDRIAAALEMTKKFTYIDQESIGAIGFCFGGLAVIELLRSGATIKGAVSFHGLLGDKIDKYNATLAPISKKIHASLLILHGYKDPMTSQSDILAFQEEMTALDVDWQMNIYGRALHAFTNPQAHNEAGGMVYNRQAAERSWKAMTNFFKEIFHS